MAVANFLSAIVLPTSIGTALAPTLATMPAPSPHSTAAVLRVLIPSATEVWTMTVASSLFAIVLPTSIGTALAPTLATMPAPRPHSTAAVLRVLIPSAAEVWTITVANSLSAIVMPTSIGTALAPTLATMPAPSPHSTTAVAVALTETSAVVLADVVVALADASAAALTDVAVALVERHPAPIGRLAGRVDLKDESPKRYKKLALTFPKKTFTLGG